MRTLLFSALFAGLREKFFPRRTWTGWFDAEESLAEPHGSAIWARW